MARKDEDEHQYEPEETVETAVGFSGIPLADGSLAVDPDQPGAFPTVSGSEEATSVSLLIYPPRSCSLAYSPAFPFVGCEQQPAQDDQEQNILESGYSLPH
jgi:hypothetical protein